jgi:predicted metal-dependent peptidase
MATLAFGKRKTFQRRDRRFADVLYLKGKLTAKTLNIGVVIDTSGSIVDFAGNFLQEVYHMSKDYGTIEVAEVDTQVNSTYMFDPNKIPSKSHGGGGTVLEPGIEYFYEGKETDRKDLIIVFTDGYCESTIKKPKGNVPIVWVVLDDAKNLAVKQPYGKVIPFDKTV